MTGAMSQHLLTDSSKARRVLRWEHADPIAGIEHSVRWHLAHPPADESGFEDDDRALAEAVQVSDRA